MKRPTRDGQFTLASQPRSAHSAHVPITYSLRIFQSTVKTKKKSHRNFKARTRQHRPIADCASATVGAVSSRQRWDAAGPGRPARLSASLGGPDSSADVGPAAQHSQHAGNTHTNTPRTRPRPLLPSPCRSHTPQVLIKARWPEIVKTANCFQSLKRNI